MTGFALFSMFFGSGNLVFPLMVGQQSQGMAGFAATGMLITGVLLPFLGVFAMLLYKGDISQFFSCLGKRATFFFVLFALAIMGPFGVLARCLTVAHGSLLFLFPNASLPLSSFAMCLVIFLITCKKNKIIPLLGAILTPLLLLCLFAIVFWGFTASPERSIDASSAVAAAAMSERAAFSLGFFKGYQFMDLLAAFFFSTFVIDHLHKVSVENHAKKALFKIFIPSSAVGAVLLALVYLTLVALGAKYADLLQDVAPQQMLGIIALAVLGPQAAPIVAVAMILACITTAIVLAALFADFLKKELCQDRIGGNSALLITLVIGFAISTLDFAGIARLLEPILEAIYPALIALTLVNIGHKCFGWARPHWPVTVTLLAKLCI